MKKLTTTLFTILLGLFLTGSIFGQAFPRVGEIPLPTGESSFGNMIAGVDFDGDGRPEIYAVNNNWNDAGAELIPKIFKYEWDGATWTMVWSATLSIPKQNTWPALTYGDWDNDNKMEVIWGPVNFTDATTNPNPARIVVFEEKGDGSDVMGVPDLGVPGNYLPNAKWSITETALENHRPFDWELADVDNDGAKELVFCTRAGAYHYGVVGVSNIPDNGDGSEVWTLEAWDQANVAAATYYDIAVMNGTIYLFNQNGDVVPVTYAAGTYTVQPALTAAAGGGSWWGSAVVDINNDGTKEIVVASWGTGVQKVYLLQGTGATLTSTEIADVASLVGTGGRLYGLAAGDIDGDNNMDFVIGSRGSNPVAAIVRLEYNGTGAINVPGSYTATRIDQDYTTSADGRWMHVAIGDVDMDPGHEVLYSEGTGEMAPIVIIDPTGSVPVELTSFSANVVDGFVKLEWSTATESNNYGFEIQRSTDGKYFSTVAFVQGNGTTVENRSYSFVDSDIEAGKYYYRLKQLDFNGDHAFSSVVEVDFNTPTEFALEQNYPNPFNPSTTISFSLAAKSSVDLRVYNMVGEEVAVLTSGQLMEAGKYQVTFDAKNLPSGTYIYRLTAGSNILTNKMVLIK